MGNLSPHFDLSEFACHHCGKTPSRSAVLPLVAVLEKARARFYPRGLVIISGYRCPVHNAAVGGKPHSRHLVGDAADIAPVMTLSQAQALGFRGVGVDVHGHACHVDMRPTPAVWHYDENGNTP